MPAKGDAMAQLVFVHGVATRQSPAYAREEKMRDDLFRRVSFAAAPSLEIANSFWGHDGAELAFKEASLPRQGQSVQAFSLGGNLGGGAQANAGQTLASIASVDFAGAIDALFVGLVEKALAEKRDLTDEEIRLFVEAAAYALQNPKPFWVKATMSDAEFVDGLREALPAALTPVSFGLLDPLKEAAGDLLNRARNMLGVGLTNAFRDELNPAVARFIGDVFVYLKDGQRRDDIRRTVIGDLVAANARRKPGESLVAVGHSLGGVILYDLLSDRPDELPASLKVDLLVTVGSQPGLFEELKLFTSSLPNIPSPGPAKAPRLAEVGDWLNVYDPIDLFGFRAEPMFDGCKDFVFSSVTGLIDAHTAYFKRPQFHQRLAERLKAQGLR